MVAQNIVASIVIAIIGLVLAATGSLTIFFAAFYHFLGDLFVFGNSFRLIRYGEEFAAHDTAANIIAKEVRPPAQASQQIETPSTQVAASAAS